MDKDEIKSGQILWIQDTHSNKIVSGQVYGFWDKYVLVAGLGASDGSSCFGHNVVHPSRCFKDQKSAIEFYKNAKLRQIAEYKNEIRNASDLILFPLKHPFHFEEEIVDEQAIQAYQERAIELGFLDEEISRKNEYVF
jgi:hypothetical protein